MLEMKGDMAGGAAVLYAMKAIAQLKPAINVVGIIPSAENTPDANAQRPGDIFTCQERQINPGGQHRRGRPAGAD
jgi:leucyl aminopeptidase